MLLPDGGVLLDGRVLLLVDGGEILLLPDGGGATTAGRGGTTAAGRWGCHCCQMGWAGPQKAMGARYRGVQVQLLRREGVWPKRRLR